MANTKRMNQILEKMGFEPEEGKMIVVSYAPENLSDMIAKLLASIFQYYNFYALSFCKDYIVLLPFSTYCADVKKDAILKKEGILELPYSSIRGVEVSEMGLNYRIDIQLEDEVISLSVQQAELSLLRMSGMYSLEDWTFVNSWHKNNLKGTLKALKEIGA
ncbi:MAG: hypothetical protein K2K46_04290 [Lachnospiraceae bacterium]|nr:hypothetical protein [Lachnospiraceae bacterium]